MCIQIQKIRLVEILFSFRYIDKFTFTLVI